MEFIVARTRDRKNYRNDMSPCKEAVRKTISYNFMGEKMTEDVWVVAIGSFEEFISFRDKYGAILVDKIMYGYNDDEIITYDYIEICDVFLYR